MLLPNYSTPALQSPYSGAHDLARMHANSTVQLDNTGPSPWLRELRTGHPVWLAVHDDPESLNHHFRQARSKKWGRLQTCHGERPADSRSSQKGHAVHRNGAAWAWSVTAADCLPQKDQRWQQNCLPDGCDGCPRSATHPPVSVHRGLTSDKRAPNYEPLPKTSRTKEG